MTYATPQNLSSIPKLFSYANSVTSNLFSTCVLVSLYIIVLGYFKGKGESLVNCMVAAGFLTSLVAVFFYLLNLATKDHLFVCIFLLFSSLIWAYVNKG